IVSELSLQLKLYLMLNFKLVELIDLPSDRITMDLKYLMRYSSTLWMNVVKSICYRIHTVIFL
ncbi:hypothetical protein L9F63_006457, partial [Diploptera punctata]